MLLPEAHGTIAPWFRRRGAGMVMQPDEPRASPSKSKAALHAGLPRQRLWPAGRLRAWFILLAATAFAAVILEAGVWVREEVHTGPFALEGGPEARSCTVMLRRAVKWGLSARGDTGADPWRSDLRLCIDGREVGPGHSQHADIRAAGGGRFSHWHGQLIFSLPEGTANGPGTRALLRYSVRPPPYVALALVLLAGILGAAHYRRALLRKSVGSGLLRAPALLARGLGHLALCGSLVYLASSALALFAGWALPTTALMRWSGLAAWAGRNEPASSHALLMLAVLGSVAAWLAPASRHTHALRRDELLARRFFWRWGFLIAASLFLFSLSAQWAGIVRPGDFHGASIGGRIAFSDAGGYWAGAHDIAKDGTWNEITLRRPLGGAFRSTLMFLGAWSSDAMLVLQALILAGTSCLATAALWRWRGMWAAFAFFGMNLMVARTFVPTSLTEPLGLSWALLAVPFFVTALRTSSLRHGLVAHALMCTALLTRMGSMLTIPALVLWLGCHFKNTWKGRALATALAVGVTLSVFLVNALLQQCYGRGQSMTGSNFSYTLCGLSIGKTWSECDEQYRKEGYEIPTDEVAHTRFLYERAWENIRARPEVFLGRLWDGSREFVKTLPDMLLQGYIQRADPPWSFRLLLALTSLAGILYLARRRRERGEGWFWLWLWGSVVASAAFVWFDDGRRVLIASYPMLCVFFAMACLGPRTQSAPPSGRGLFVTGVATLCASALLFLTVPWIAHRLSAVPATAAPLLQPDQAVVSGGRRMNGFLVVADSEPLRTDVPSLHLSEFAAIVKQSTLEDLYQGIIHPQMPPLPFGFVAMPRLEPGAHSYHQFLVPAEVMERHDVPAWRLHLQEWNRTKAYGPYWFFVPRAEALR